MPDETEAPEPTEGELPDGALRPPPEHVHVGEGEDDPEPDPEPETKPAAGDDGQT